MLYILLTVTTSVFLLVVFKLFVKYKVNTLARVRKIDDQYEKQ